MIHAAKNRSRSKNSRNDRFIHNDYKKDTRLPGCREHQDKLNMSDLHLHIGNVNKKKIFFKINDLTKVADNRR